MALKQIKRSEKAARIGRGKFGEGFAETVGREIEALQFALDKAEPKEAEERIRSLARVSDPALPWFGRSAFIEYTEAMVMALVVALILRTFVIQAFKIPSGSMIPTLKIGDHLMVWKLPYGFIIPFTDAKLFPMTSPKRGDIVVFKYPEDPSKDFIKRIVAVPGDTLEIRGDEVSINKKVLPHRKIGTYQLDNPDFGTREAYDLIDEDLDGVKHWIIQIPRRLRKDIPSTVIPAGKYFMMGDNRDNSQDSRYWGLVDFNQIRGKALFIYWSFGSKESWKRIGRLIE